jgi:hypothetical protein
MLFELSWSHKLFAVIFQSIFGIVLVKLNLSKDINTKSSKIMYNLLSECFLVFSIVPYLIENYVLKKDYLKNKSVQCKTVDGYSTDSKIKIGFICLFTSIVKFFYALLFYYYLLEIANDETRDLLLNVYIIPSVIIMIFLRKFILHREYYRHHIITILIISGISILLTCINLILYRLGNSSSENFKYLLFSSLLFVFVTLMYIIYKYTYEYYYINLHLFNAIEAGLICIYTFIFYFIKIHKEDEEKDQMFKHFGKFLIACFANLIINTLIKYIIYVYNEMYALIPLYIEIIYNIVDYLGKDEYERDINSFFKYLLFIIQIVLYVLSILFVGIFFEIIIVHRWDLEKNTKKYLKKIEIKEITPSSQDSQSSMISN